MRAQTLIDNPHYQRVYGFPFTNDATVIDKDTIYGFSWGFTGTDLWKHDVGSFEYLFGLYRGLLSMNEESNAILYAEEIGEMNLDTVFFVLNLDHQPVALITSAVLGPELLAGIGQPSMPGHNLILRDLTTTPDAETNPVNFEH